MFSHSSSLTFLILYYGVINNFGRGEGALKCSVMINISHSPSNAYKKNCGPLLNV